MKKSILETYALVVCFFTVGCFVIVIGMALWNLVTITAPEFTLDNYVWQYHQTDEAFKERLVNNHRARTEKQVYAPPEGAALTEAREKSLVHAISAERREATQNLARYFIVLLVDIIVFFVHWKLATRARQSGG